MENERRIGSIANGQKERNCRRDGGIECAEKETSRKKYSLNK